MLFKDNSHGIASSPVEQAGTRPPSGLILSNSGNISFLGSHRPGVSEKFGDADQKSFVERVYFRWVFLEITDIIRYVIDLVDIHPPFNIASDTALL